MPITYNASFIPYSGPSTLHGSLIKPLPTVLSASGIWLHFETGERVVDASGGAAVSCIGHGNKTVAGEYSKQVRILDYYAHVYMKGPMSEELAEYLIRSTHGQMSGKVHFISRELSYHCNTVGARSITLLRNTSKNTSRISACCSHRGMQQGESKTEYASRLGQELENEILRVGPQHVAAFTAEPWGGAASGSAPPYKILPIFDEVMAGISRVGPQNYRCCPRHVTIGKALTGSYAPLAALIVSHKVLSFVYGHTYLAHEPAFKAALIVQKYIQDGDYHERVKIIGLQLDLGLKKSLDAHPHDKNTKKPFSPKREISSQLLEHAMKTGVFFYPSSETAGHLGGDHVLIAPRFTTTNEELQLLIDKVVQTIHGFFKNIS
ncbi:PLP-dependent transferase [Polychaeton citri CBS 116435]|uniref:PLP-dependent transferase n=1 Tax=Polychaeton citri CBS 116435 TaxID=1314669 RepID=A0A9P4Q333_9PEZI|nr:PLP-dependent transferase [Polychaeton citri CBS 116435]